MTAGNVPRDPPPSKVAEYMVSTHPIWKPRGGGSLAKNPKNAPSSNDQLMTIIRNVGLPRPTALANKALSGDLNNVLDSLCHVLRSGDVPRAKGDLSEPFLKVGDLKGVSKQRVI